MGRQGLWGEIFWLLKLLLSRGREMPGARLRFGLDPLQMPAKPCILGSDGEEMGRLRACLHCGAKSGSCHGVASTLPLSIHKTRVMVTESGAFGPG